MRLGTSCNVDAADTGVDMLKHIGVGMMAMVSNAVKVKVGAREIPSTRVSNTLHSIEALVTGSKVRLRSQRAQADTRLRGQMTGKGPARAERPGTHGT